MPSLNRHEKVQCGDCGNMYIRQHASRHRKSCQAGIISCPDCKYFTYNKQDMNYHVAKKHAPSISSNEQFAHLARWSFRVTNRSSNIREKNMERNNGNQVIQWQT